MTDSERAWGKAHGLKKTNMKTVNGAHGRHASRWVYRANDGSLYFKDRGIWVGTFENYCFTVNAR